MRVPDITIPFEIRELAAHQFAHLMRKARDWRKKLRDEKCDVVN